MAGYYDTSYQQVPMYQQQPMYYQEPMYQQPNMYDYSQQASYSYGIPEPKIKPNQRLFKHSIKSTKSVAPSRLPLKQTKPVRLPPLQKQKSNPKMKPVKTEHYIGPIHRHAKEIVSNNPKGALRQLYDRQSAAKSSTNHSHLNTVYNSY
jgi:hypothetical protein